MQQKETVLNAVLREGFEFPNRCRVGACGTCRCKLESGTVKELTDKAYVLSKKEISEGYILACQSIATSDISIRIKE